MAHTEDIQLDQGTDVSIEVTLINYDKTPKNLVGHLVKGIIKPSVESEDAIEFATAKTDALNGVIDLVLTAAQTQIMNHRRRYAYEVEIVHVNEENGDTVRERVLQGIITIVPALRLSVATQPIP